MNQPLSATKFCDFNYDISEVEKFICSSNIFTIMLKSKAIIHYTPDKTEDFKEWLEYHNITDVRGNKLEIRYRV